MNTKKGRPGFITQQILPVTDSNIFQAQSITAPMIVIPAYINRISPMESTNLNFQENWSGSSFLNASYGNGYQLDDGTVPFNPQYSIPAPENNVFGVGRFSPYPVPATPVYTNSFIPNFPQVVPILHNIYNPLESSNITFQRKWNDVNSSSNFSYVNAEQFINRTVPLEKSNSFSTRSSPTASDSRTENIPDITVNMEESRQRFKMQNTIPAMASSNEIQVESATVPVGKTTVSRNRICPIKSKNISCQRSCRDVNSSKVSHYDDDQLVCTSVLVDKSNSTSAKSSAIVTGSRIENIQDVVMNTNGKICRFNVQNIIPVIDSNDSEVESETSPTATIPVYSDSPVEPTNITSQRISNDVTSLKVSYDECDQLLDGNVPSQTSDFSSTQSSTLATGARTKNIQNATRSRKKRNRRFNMQHTVREMGNDELVNESAISSVLPISSCRHRINPTESSNITFQRNWSSETSSNVSYGDDDQLANINNLIEKSDSSLRKSSITTAGVRIENNQDITMDMTKSSRYFDMQHTVPSTDNNEFHVESAVAPTAITPHYRNRISPVESTKVTAQRNLRNLNFLKVSYDSGDELINKAFSSEKSNSFLTQSCATANDLTNENSQDVSMNTKEGNQCFNTQHINSVIDNNKFQLQSPTTSKATTRVNRNRINPVESNIVAFQRNLNDGNSSNALHNNRDQLTNETVPTRELNSFSTQSSFICSGARTTENIQDTTMNMREENGRAFMEHIAPTTSNVFPSNSVSSSQATRPTSFINAEISGERSMSHYRKMRDSIQTISNNIVISFMRRIRPAERNDAVPVAQASTSSATLTTSAINITPDNPEESSRENEVSSKRSVLNDSKPATTRNSIEIQNMESLNNPREISGSVALFCAVCLDDYNGILNKSAHFVAFNCGHIFCNLCAIRLMASKRCPRCRSYIRKILRLYI